MQGINTSVAVKRFGINFYRLSCIFHCFYLTTENMTINLKNPQSKVFPLTSCDAKDSSISEVRLQREPIILRKVAFGEESFDNFYFRTSIDARRSFL